MANHPDLARQVLPDNNRNYSKSTFQYNLLRLVTGDGLLTSDGDFWLRQRRLAQPVFHRQRIAGLRQMIARAAVAMVSRGERLPPSAVLDVDSEMMQVILEIVGRALFSTDLSRDAAALSGAVLTTLDYIMPRSLVPYTLPLVVPTRRNGRSKAALQALDDTVQVLIADRRARPGQTDDLLAMLLAARDEDTGRGMDDRQLRDEVLTLIIAGHETVASALTRTW